MFGSRDRIASNNNNNMMLFLFGECWKVFGNNNDNKTQAQQQQVSLLWKNDDVDSTNTKQQQQLGPDVKIEMPKYRILRQNQCRLLWLLSRITNQSSLSTNRIDDNDNYYRTRSMDQCHCWYDIWDRCEQYKDELYVVDSYTGRTPLHIALVKLTSSNNNSTYDITNHYSESDAAEHTMWEHVIESMMELNPHSLIVIDKHNYTPIHLLCNLAKIVQQQQQSKESFHLFSMIIRTLLDIPKLYSLPSHEVAIISIAKKPISQSIQPPSPLLLACRKNISIESLYWLLRTKNVFSLSWIAPWTGGETIQDVVSLRWNSHYNNPKNKQLLVCNDHLHWNLLEIHETPLETLLLIPHDDVYGKRIFSMIKMVQENNEERLLWRNIACKLYDLFAQDDSEINNDEKIYLSILDVVHDFISSTIPSLLSTVGNTLLSATTPSDHGHSSTISVTPSDMDDDPEYIELTKHVHNVRNLWIKTIMLLHSATTNPDENDRNYYHKSIQHMVHQVSCLFRPIPELLQLVSFIFEEQLDYNKLLSDHDDSQYVVTPLNQVLILLPMYESEEKRQQDRSSNHNKISIIRSNTIATTNVTNNSSERNHAIQETSSGSISSSPTTTPRRLSRERSNLYMHTRFDFTAPPTRDDNNESLLNEEILNTTRSRLGLCVHLYSKSVSKILETQLRVLIEAQPDALTIPVSVSLLEQNLYFHYYFMTSTKHDEQNNKTKRLPFWLRDIIFKEHEIEQQEQQQQPVELVYYPFFVGAAHNCSLDTIYRMIRYAPEALQLQQKQRRREDSK